MIDRGQQTVRELRESVREWAQDVDEMSRLIGHDRWLDITVQDFQRMGASEDPVAMVVMWAQIASLPECDDERRTT